MIKTLAKSAAFAACMGGAFWVNGAVADYVSPIFAADTQKMSGMSAKEQEKLEKFASASLFGQFRSSVADFLWLKVDKYLHNGVDLRGTTDAEKAAHDADHVKSALGEEGNRAHWGGEETTIVPSKAHDWRGKFGDVERAIQPYQDMDGHKHRDPKEALPLFRLMTLSNPHFVPGYTVGGFMIARDKTKIKEAEAFLLEGAKQNPQSIEIEEALGNLLTVHERDFPAALPHLQKALALGASRDPKTLTDDESESYENAFRWLVLNRREMGDTKGAMEAARQGIAHFPQDPVCRHYLEWKR